MNKLFENWRGYLFEQEASWVEDLKKDTWVVLDKTKFKEIGSGAFQKHTPMVHVVKGRQEKNVVMNGL